MSELKAYKNLECAFSTSSLQEIVVAEDSEGESIVFEEGDEVYLKSEADNVIAEKDKKIAGLKKACNDKDDWCLHTLKENRHQKYKRCLAMAKWCRRNRLNASVCGPIVKIDFWEKWYKRWLELAEKFKEVK